MKKKVLTIVLLLAVLAALGVVGYKYQHYYDEPPLDVVVDFNFLYKAVTDQDNSVYAIADSKHTIYKYNEEGTLKYLINHPKTDETREYSIFTDLAADSKGYVYALSMIKDVNGLIIKQEQISRYTPDGQLDTSWAPYTINYDIRKGLQSGTIRSLQIKNDELYFYTENPESLTLYKFGRSGEDVHALFEKPIPADAYVDEVIGTNPDNIVYTTHRGEMYKLGTGLMYPLPGQSGDAKRFPERIHFDKDEKSVIFIDEYGEAIKKINIDTPTMVEKLLTEKTAEQALPEKAPITSLDISTKGDLLLGTDTHVVHMAPNHQVNTLYYSGMMKLIRYLFWAGILIAAASIIWIGKIIYVDLMPYSIIYKQIFILVPLILGAMLALTFVIKDQTETNMSLESERGLIFLAHDGQNLIDGNAFAAITSPKDYMDADYQKMIEKLHYDDNFGKFYVTLYKYSEADHQMYAVEDNDYKMFESFPVDELDDGVTCHARDDAGNWVDVTDAKRVVKDRGYITCLGDDEDGRWMYAQGPIFSADKSKVIGVYEAGINLFAFQNRLDSMTYLSYEIIAGIAVVIVLAFIIITMIQMSSIRKLRDSVSEISQGNWNAAVTITSKDEVADLGKRFNFMTESIRRYIEEVKAYNASYSRFVPQQFLDFLGKQSILDVELGDQKEQEMSVLVAEIRSFHAMSNDMTPEENFNFTNKFLEHICPFIRDNNGLINKYLGSGIIALFPNDPAEAVKASVEMRRSLEAYNLSRIRKGKRPVDVGIGIHKGSLMLGIIGEDQRLEGNVISDDVNFATVLEKLSEKLGATILVADDVMEGMSRPEAYHARSLGLLVLEGSSGPVHLYDIFDGDIEEQRKLKLKTKELFETAVTLYQNGRFFDARETFLQVIKLNPDDKAAKLYFYQADEFFQKGTTNDWNGTLSV